MAFDVNELLRDLFGDDHQGCDQEDGLWINTDEFSRRTAKMSAEQVGVLLLEIVELHRRGLMRNGPAVRIDPPQSEEAKDGTNAG